MLGVLLSGSLDEVLVRLRAPFPLRARLERVRVAGSCDSAASV